MSYATIGDILKYSADLHVHAKRLYDQLRDETQRERVDMMLKLLIEHETHLHGYVSDLQESAGKKVLSEWHQFEPTQLEEVTSHCKELHQDMSVEDLVNVALKVDDFMIGFYKQIASETTSKEAREVFTNLIALEENEKMQIVRASLSAYDW